MSDVSQALVAAGNRVRLPPWRIETHDSLPSTQELLKARVREGLDVDGMVLRALRQTSGLGRRGKSWSGPAGGSYQSVAVRDEGRRLRRPWTSLAAAIGIAEELRSAGATVSVKWPNDLYLAGNEPAGTEPAAGQRAGNTLNTGPRPGNKLGGVLSEHLKSHLVVGVGVNVANEVPKGAGALRGWDLPLVNDLVLRGLRRGLEELVLESSSAHGVDEGSSVLPTRYDAFDLLSGTHVVVRTPHGEVEGIARGVDHHGMLVLEGASGTKSVAAGTVLSWR